MTVRVAVISSCRAAWKYGGLCCFWDIHMERELEVVQCSGTGFILRSNSWRRSGAADLVNAWMLGSENRLREITP